MLERRGDGPSLADIMGRRELAGRGEGQLSRRELLRKALLAGVVVWGIEAAALAIGGLWPTGSRASTKVRVGTLEELIAANPGLPIDEGFPAYVPAARAFVMLLDPGRRIFLHGDRRDRRRQRAQCPRAVADLSAPGLPPEPVHRGLLVALPLSPVALRPARDQDRGRAVRAGAAQHGPLPHRGRRARRADDRHAQGDPWAGAEGAR